MNFFSKFLWKSVPPPEKKSWLRPWAEVHSISVHPDWNPEAATGAGELNSISTSAPYFLAMPDHSWLGNMLVSWPTSFSVDNFRCKYSRKTTIPQIIWKSIYRSENHAIHNCCNKLLNMPKVAKPPSEVF